MLLVEQYWSFINSVVNPTQARRVNGPICGIASLSAISGGILVQAWAKGLGQRPCFSLPGCPLFLLGFSLG